MNSKRHLPLTLWLLGLAAALTQLCLGHVPEIREVDYDMYDEDGNSTTTATPSPEPVLTPEAIANIIATGAAIIFLTVSIIILFCTFEKGEHQLRVKTALERNKQIDKQMAIEKQMKEARAEKFRQKQAAEAAANVLQVRSTVTESGEVKYEEAGPQTTITLEDELTANKSSERQTTQLTVDTSPNEVVVDLQSTNDSPSEGRRPLVNVPLDSYVPGSIEQQHPGTSVILVQPAKDS